MKTSTSFASSINSTPKKRLGSSKTEKMVWDKKSTGSEYTPETSGDSSSDGDEDKAKASNRVRSRDLTADRNRKRRRPSSKSAGSVRNTKKGKVEAGKNRNLKEKKEKKKKSPKKKVDEIVIDTSAASSSSGGPLGHEMTIEEINASLQKQKSVKKKKGAKGDDGEDDDAAVVEGDFKQMTGEQVATVFKHYGLCKDVDIHGASVVEVSGGLKHYDVKIGLIE